MENEQKNKMTTGQKVKLCFVILAIIMVLGAIAVAILLPYLPKNLTSLPLVLFVSALIIMLILKTTGKPAISIPRPEQLGGEDIDEEPNADEQTNAEVQADNTSDSESAKPKK